MVIIFPHYLLLCCTWIHKKMQLFACLAAQSVNREIVTNAWPRQTYFKSHYKVWAGLPCLGAPLIPKRLMWFEEREGSPDGVAVRLGTQPLACKVLVFCTNIWRCYSFIRVRYLFKQLLLLLDYARCVNRDCRANSIDDLSVGRQGCAESCVLLPAGNPGPGENTCATSAGINTSFNVISYLNTFLKEKVRKEARMAKAVLQACKLLIDDSS